VYRAQDSSAPQLAGEVMTGHRSQPVVISTSDMTIYSDGWGQAGFAPQVLATWGAVRLEIQASAGGQTVNFTLHTLTATAPDPSERQTLRNSHGEIQN
jgi:hypothetical protein